MTTSAKRLATTADVVEHADARRRRRASTARADTRRSAIAQPNTTLFSTPEPTSHRSSDLLRALEIGGERDVEAEHRDTNTPPRMPTEVADERQQRRRRRRAR